MAPPTLAATEPVAAQPDFSGWQARLALRFAKQDGTGTRLVHNRHEGPLRLLKALASGDGRRLEAVIVHPPGGLVGGDSLALEIELAAGAQVLATTPGAQKWYRGEAAATATTRITLAAGARLEWLPQPAILFDQSHARQSLMIEVDPAAVCVGWEVLVRGRKAMGERTSTGHIEQSLSISVGQRPLWQERLHADAGDRIFQSPIGWGGQPIAASVWCCAPSLGAARLRALRDAWRGLLEGAPEAAAEAPPEAAAASPMPSAAGDPGRVRGGATVAAEGLLLAKMLAGDSEQLMATCQSMWRAARLALDGDEGSTPRVWRT